MTPGKNGWLPPEQHLAGLAHATMSGVAYFTDTEGNPLALQPTYGRPGRWQCPGGFMEREDPTPLHTAVRETFEETGIRLAGEDLPPLLIHYLAPEPTWQGYARIRFIYDGGRLSAAQLAAIVLNADEHSAWHVRSLADWETLMSARDFAWFSACDQGRRTGRTQVLYEDYGAGPGNAGIDDRSTTTVADGATAAAD